VIRNLAYFDRWTDSIAEQILAREAELCVQRLALAGDEDESWGELARAHGYQALTLTEARTRPEVGERFLPGAGLIARCPELLAICTPGAGYDVVDVEAATAAGVIVCNNSGPGAEAVAEHLLGFMLALAKKIARADRALRRAPPGDREVFRGSELRGRVLGVIGLGRIGARLAELCERAFSMPVLAHDPLLSADEVARRGARTVGLDELLERADFIALTCPLTSQTRGMLGREQFARMKRGAFFVTAARGGVHDEAALCDALESGRIAGAGLDVFEQEPPPPDHPLLQLDSVIATPHVAGITVESGRELARAAAEQWIAIFKGAVPPRLINPAAWPRYCERFEKRLGFRPAVLE